MFQNINENTIEYEKTSKKQKNKESILKNVFAKQHIIIYIVSFMLAQVSINYEFPIFSISMLGACLASSVPILGVAIVSILGTAIKFGVSGILNYIITLLVMVVTLYIIKPRYNEQERNEKIKIATNVFISVLLVQVVQYIFTRFTLYDILSSITLAIIGVVFYKIFVNSLTVIKEINKQKAFSIEEVIGASILLSIAVASLGKLDIMGFSICNILSILIVMILGWKNGILVGTTSGVTIGVTVGVITGTDPMMIAAYSISGMVAGILNRFGKVGVVIGFALGNVVLAYISNGFTVELIHFKEILIASIGLLAVPKSFQIDLEEFIGNSKFLPVVPDRALNKSKEVAKNLNEVSQAIDKMATTYSSEEPAILENRSMQQENKHVFTNELLNNLESYKENMLYDDLVNTEGEIVERIFQFLLDKQEIKKEDLLKIFAECNSYIVGFEDKEISEYLEENISQAIRAINLSYRISKTNFICNKKIEENKKNIEKQLKRSIKSNQKHGTNNRTRCKNRRKI